MKTAAKNVTTRNSHQAKPLIGALPKPAVSFVAKTPGRRTTQRRWRLLGSGSFPWVIQLIPPASLSLLLSLCGRPHHHRRLAGGKKAPAAQRWHFSPTFFGANARRPRERDQAGMGKVDFSRHSRRCCACATGFNCHMHVLQ